MRKVTVLTAIALMLGLAAADGAQAARTDLWSGTWTFTADRGATYGTLKLRMADDNTTVSGHYTGATSGRIGGELNQEFGRVWCGTFRDTAGANRNKGKFCATIQSDQVSFIGWYKPCRVFCRSQPWSGERTG